MVTSSDDMESKIKEIERLIAEFMDEYPNGCLDISCDNCPINKIYDSGVRTLLCEKMYDDIPK